MTGSKSILSPQVNCNPTDQFKVFYIILIPFNSYKVVQIKSIIINELIYVIFLFYLKIDAINISNTIFYSATNTSLPNQNIKHNICFLIQNMKHSIYMQIIFINPNFSFSTCKNHYIVTVVAVAKINLFYFIFQSIFAFLFVKIATWG